MISKKKRIATYTELRSHLLQEFDVLSARGFDSETICCEILKTKPNPYYFGYKLRRSQQSFLRRNSISLLAIFGFMIFLLIGQYINQVIQRDYNALLEKLKLSEKRLAQFADDLKFLNKHPNLEVLKLNGKKSADVFLYRQLDRKKIQGIPKIYATIRYQPLKETQIKAELDALDLSWVEQLQKFDHLSYLSFDDREDLRNNLENSMIRKIEAHSLTGRGSLFLTENIGNSVYLNTYKNCYEGHCVEGLKNLRHFARLLYSTKAFFAQTNAIGYLKLEKFFVQKFRVKNYPLLDEEFLNASERVNWGWIGILGDMLANQKFSDRWQPFMKPELGLCGAVENQPFGTFVAFSDLLGEHSLFEEDYRDRIAKEKILLYELYKKCDMKIYSDLIRTPNSKRRTLGYMDTVPAIIQPWVDEASVPYFRQWLASYWRSLTFATYWGIYERLPPKVSPYIK